MLMWTVEACVNVNKVSKVIISTDSEEYWQTVRSFCDSKKLELDLRTPEQAGDEVKIFDYLKSEREKLQYESGTNKGDNGRGVDNLSDEDSIVVS